MGLHYFLTMFESVLCVVSLLVHSFKRDSEYEFITLSEVLFPGVMPHIDALWGGSLASAGTLVLHLNEICHLVNMEVPPWHRFHVVRVRPHIDGHRFGDVDGRRSPADPRLYDVAFQSDTQRP